MPHAFEAGAIEIERFYTGVISNRNPLAVPVKMMGRRLIELYDAILSGQNAEISVRSTIQRAAGFIPYNINPVSGIPQKFYAFQSTAQPGTIFPVVDTSTGVFSVPPGAAVPLSIASKSQGKQSSFFGLGSFLYIGNVDFLKKWDSSSVTNWGIGPYSGSTAPTANTGTGANGSGNPWTNPTNIQGAPGHGAPDYATNTVSTVINTGQLSCTNFGFAVGASNAITGIQVFLTGHTSAVGVIAATVQLQQGGLALGNPQTIFLTSSDTTGNAGGSSFLWGAVITPTIVDDATFGVLVSVGHQLNAGAGTTVSLNACQITVFSTGAPSVVVNAGAGAMTATQGYQYVAAYYNPVDGNIGNPSTPSGTTGPFTKKLNVQITLTASTDPQVTLIRVFRTTDTGTGSVFFELPNSPFPNASATVNDTATDVQLVVTQSVQSPTLAFSVPPSGIGLIEWYAGRLWGAVANLLYFSAGPDNFPMGNGASDWPPANVFALPTQIVKLAALNGGNGMLVVTLDGIHVVQGITNPGFTVNKWLSDVGARQQNAVDSDGSNLYMFTSDRQFVQIGASGINELSQPISDQTDNLDPTAVYVMQHRSGSQDSRIFLADGSTSWYPYNAMVGCWEPVRTPADGAGLGAVGSIEITPGVFKLLKGGTSSGQLILQRDLTTFSDNGRPYYWNLVFGSIPLADPTQLANLESFVLRSRNMASPTISILPNDTDQTKFKQLGNPVFEPPEGTAGPTGFTASKYYMDTAPGMWTQMTHLQIKIQGTNTTTQDEILSMGIFPNQTTDQASSQLPQIQGR